MFWGKVYNSKKQHRHDEQKDETNTNQIQNVDSEVWREPNLKLFCHVESSFFVVGFFTNESGCQKMSFRLLRFDKFDKELAQKNLYCMDVCISVQITESLQENEIGPIAMNRLLQDIKDNWKYLIDPADIFRFLQGTSDLPKPVQECSRNLSYQKNKNRNMLPFKQLMNSEERLNMDRFIKICHVLTNCDERIHTLKSVVSEKRIQYSFDKLPLDQTYDKQQSSWNALPTDPVRIDTMTDDRTNTFKDKADDSLRQSQHYFSSMQGADLSQDREDTDNQSNLTSICEVNSCKCPFHRDITDKNNRLAYKQHYKDSTSQTALKTRRNNSHYKYTSAGDAGCDEMSSDESSSENAFGFLRKHEKRKLSDIALNRSINNKEWDDAIVEKDDDAITELLKAEYLPNSNQIRNALKEFGKESDVMTRICFEVSRSILKRDDHIVRVEPAYKSPGEVDVFFIVYLKQPQTDLSFADLQLKVVTRVIGQYTAEGKDIVDREVSEQLQFTLEEADRLRTCLEKNSKQLMEKHCNLQMISASHFKSKYYGNKGLEKTLCVVFYVRVKGFIPFTEERLPTTLEGIQTDVREGGFEFLTNATDRHTNLKIGCEIAGAGKDNFSGTLGPFLEENGNIYCLTSAHVLYGLPPNGETEHDWPSIKCGNKTVDVFQPNPNRFSFMSEPFGSVYLAKYKQGDNNSPGIDVAVIHVQDKTRRPISGEFPESDESSLMEEDRDNNGNELQELTYHTGAICEREFLKKNNAVKVFKFGAATGETCGLLKLDGTSVRYDNCLTDDNKSILLYKQIEITKSVDDQIFADKGDSGAAILVAYCGNIHDLRAVGLLTGKSSTGTIIATPMYALFDELKLINRNFMNFQQQNVNQSLSIDSAGPDQMAAAIQRDLENNYLQPRLDTMESTLKATISSEVQTQFQGFANQMVQFLNQRLPQNQGGNAGSNI